MAKVIAFDRNRARSKPHSAAYADRFSSKVGASGGSRVHLFPQKKEDIQVSVVVTVGERPHSLSHCLAALLFQHFGAARYEIIVVGDRHNASTRDIAQDWANHAARTGPSISYIAGHGTRSSAIARNQGWRAARGHIVAFVNDDTVVRPDWLQKGFQAFDENVQAVWGCVVAPPSAKTTTEASVSTPAEQQGFSTPNCFIRKEVLEEVDGFDERFRFAWGEEADLYFRLVNRKSRIVHHPSAIVTHSTQPLDWRNSLSQQRKLQSDALLYKKHPQLYRQKICEAPRWDHYLIVAALIFTLVFASLGQAMLAMAAGGIWVASTARFCIRRLSNSEKTASRIAEVLVTSILIPPLAVFWRLVGIVKFRTAFF